MNSNFMRWKKRKQKRPAVAGSPTQDTSAWATSALPLSHDSWTATNPPKSSTCPAQVVLIASVHTWQPLSMCRQNSIRGWLENSAKNPCWVVLCAKGWLEISEDCNPYVFLFILSRWLGGGFIYCLYVLLSSLHTSWHQGQSCSLCTDGCKRWE